MTMVEDEENIIDAFMVEEEVKSTRAWVLDMRCAFHICHREQDFVCFGRCEGEEINLPNG